MCFNIGTRIESLPFKGYNAKEEKKKEKAKSMKNENEMLQDNYTTREHDHGHKVQNCTTGQKYIICPTQKNKIIVNKKTPKK